MGNAVWRILMVGLVASLLIAGVVALRASRATFSLAQARQLTESSPAQDFAAFWAAPRAEVLRLKVGDKQLRTFATKTISPVYPTQPLKQGIQGAVTAQLSLDDKGKLLHVEILDSPEGQLSAAVISALRQWQFKPPMIKNEHAALAGLTGGPAFVKGTLIFHFEIDEAGGHVYSPAEIREKGQRQ